MTLAVDARWMVGRYRGMGRYAHQLIAPVSRRVHALLPRGLTLPAFPCVSAGPSFYPYWEQVVLPRLCRECGVTTLLSPYNTAPLRLPPTTRMILVVHDLIFLEPWSQLPPSVSVYQTSGRLYRSYIVPRVIGSADHLVTVSQYTRDRISEKFSISKRDIHVIPNSLDESWYVDAPLPWTRRQPYLLAVSGEAPSKNLAALIRAFGEFKRLVGKAASECTLRIVGITAAHRPHFQRIADDAGVGALAVFEPFVDEKQLRKIYREAWLFVMPSLYEGFGIPLLESMASGTPVVCSNTTSLPEVIGDAGWLFNPRDEVDMATQLCAAWSDHSGRREMAQRGLSRARLFSHGRVQEAISEFWLAI